MTNYLTKQGLSDVQDQLKEIKETKMPEVLDSLSRARAEGDLKENAGYDAAKTLQAQLQSKIDELEEVLSSYEIIAEKEIGSATAVVIGTTVEIEYTSTENKENFTLKIVGSSEANAIKNLISNESPLAAAIMNKRVGDSADFSIRGKKMTVKIIDIK